MTRDLLIRHAVAADDPNILMDDATAAFAEMTAASRRGDRDARRGTAIVVGDTCLRLCITPSASVRAAEEKARFLAIAIKWAWPREPALGAVLEAAWRAEDRVRSGTL